MLKPNYENGSIPNLMSSIGKLFGYKSPYAPLPLDISLNKNVVLIVIDGLGYEYLKKHKNSTLYKHMVGNLTSVFPSSTGAAMPSYFSGLAPNNHGMNGWFVYLTSTGFQIKSLPYMLRSYNISATTIAPMKEVFSLDPIFNKLSVQSYLLNPKEYINSEFSKLSGGKAKRVPYTTLNSFFTQIKKTTTRNNRRKFIFAYYPFFDLLEHYEGVSSKKTEKHFQEMDVAFAKYIKSLEDTTVILSSDHGHIDIPPKKSLSLSDYPEVKKMLQSPLSGEPRVAYCYVKKEYLKDFPRIIQKYLGKYLAVFPSKELVRKGYFGLFKPTPDLMDRIGDYTIIMKDNYALYDPMPHEKLKIMKGLHGGLTKEELYIPLVIVNEDSNKKKK